MPLVSVVIPTFGRPQLLAKAVDSVLAQTLTDLELIVVIDGDDPATCAYLDAVADPRVRRIVQDTQRGPGEARNTGALAGAGRWVAFLDDDDIWRPAKLHRQVEAADGRRAIVMTLSDVVTPEGTFVRPTTVYDGAQPFSEWLFDRRSWLKGGMAFLQTSSLMLPRALFDDLRFRHSRQHEDWELVIEAIVRHGYELVTVPEPLTVHHVDHRRKSLSSERRWAASLEWADRIRPLLTPRAYSGFVLTGIGLSSANSGEWSAIGPLLKAAFKGGRPSPQQLFRFGMSWALTPAVRRRVRAMWQAERKPAGGGPASAADKL